MRYYQYQFCQGQRVDSEMQKTSKIVYVIMWLLSFLFLAFLAERKGQIVGVSSDEDGTSEWVKLSDVANVFCNNERLA